LEVEVSRRAERPPDFDTRTRGARVKVKAQIKAGQILWGD
jgi:hypothetical protein